MNHEIIIEGDLLNENGMLNQTGWAKDLILNYNKDAIKVSKLRIKEWDYYCILSPNYGVAFTIADLGYAGLIIVSYLNFNKKLDITNNCVTLFPLRRFNLPRTSKEGNVKFSNKQVSIAYIKGKEERYIKICFPYFNKNNSLIGELKLIQPSDLETMTIVTPFYEDKYAFYYNQKINCMRAEGFIKLGDEKLIFNKEDSFGVLDWGRGVWTYFNTWYWGSASGLVDGIPFGFNIGYGFGDTSNASENMIFYNNKAHKLDQVEFIIPKDNFLKQWIFTSNDNRFELKFNPIMDRNCNLDFGLLKSIQHQVFGYFTGKVILDDGMEIYLDNFLGFAEKVVNKW